MPKTSGLGDNFYVGAYDLSGDINALGTVGGSVGTLDVTSIRSYGYERIGGLRTGVMEFTSLFNVDAGQEHVAFKSLPTSNVIMTYCRGTSLGSPAASMIGKQINYDPTRGDDGSMKFSVQAQSDGYGLEWGRLLTAGMRTDTSATNGLSIDTTASASFGGQAYLHITAFTGTDVTIKIQDSADNSNWTDVTGFTFGSVTGLTSARIQLGSTATVRRYLRVVTTTTGGFTGVTFAVNVVKNTVATAF